MLLSSCEGTPTMIETTSTGLTALHSYERTMSPRQTLARLRPHFASLGITRLGELTGLDHLGIPIAMAVRPNSYSLAVSLGKGPDRDAALVSAAMEAAETAVAERLPMDLLRVSFDELRYAGQTSVDLHEMARYQPKLIGSGDKVAWAAGYDLTSRARIHVPWGLVGLDHRVSPDGYHDAFYPTSDGLASGNTIEEATFHGLCELIERDAFARLQCGGGQQLAKSQIRLNGQEDPQLPALLEHIARAGLDLLVFDMTSDIEVPAYLALLQARHHQYVGKGLTPAQCGGCGCHPAAGRAIVKAITEAAQARVALVAGARDDIRSHHYATKRDMKIKEAASGAARSSHGPAADRLKPRTLVPSSKGFGERLGDLVERLNYAGVRKVTVVELDTRPGDFNVVRVLGDGLQVPLQGNRVQMTERSLRHLREIAA